MNFYRATVFISQWKDLQLSSFFDEKICLLYKLLILPSVRRITPLKENVPINTLSALIPIVYLCHVHDCGSNSIYFVQKTGLKWPLKNRQSRSLNHKWYLNEGWKYFWPALSNNWSWKPILILRHVLTLNTPIATKVVCFSRLLKCLRSLYGKQCGPRSDCSYRSSSRCLLLYLIRQ